MEMMVGLAIGLALFGLGFLLGTFIEVIRSIILLLRMENAIQQQHIDQQIKIITNTNLAALDEESTKDLPRYTDDY